MRRAQSLSYLILILLGFTLTPVVQGQDAASDLLGRINGLRVGLGLPGYTLNGALNSAATSHAQWMAQSGQVSHVQPNGSRPRDRAAAAGYVSNWVSENIYMGSSPGPDTAWQFWLNSAIHYAGLTSPNYRDIGIGVASANGNWAYVLVFGNPDGSSGVRVPSNASSAGSGTQRAAPSYVVGLDAVGNIMHEVQPSDTLGDIALIYGYSWEAIPGILELNGMTWDDIRTLKIGSIILVPPYDGTYTPTPSESSVTPTASITPTATASPTATNTPPATATPPASLSNPVVDAEGDPTPQATATNGLIIRTLPAPTQVAQLGTQSIDALPVTLAIVPASDGPPAWIVVAVILQICILGGAIFEFWRRR